MATIPKMSVEVAKTLHGGPPLVLHYPEAASQSFKKGEFVFLVAGKATVCGADPLEILGVALEDASGVTDNDVPVVVLTEDLILVANLAVSQVTAQSLVGTRKGITLASNLWHVDTTKTGTTARVTVIMLDTRDVVGDVNGRVHFIVLGNFRQLTLTS